MPTFVNVYDKKGTVLLLAFEGSLDRAKQMAFYQFGLTSPDYDVCQTKEAATVFAAKHR